MSEPEATQPSSSEPRAMSVKVEIPIDVNVASDIDLSLENIISPLNENSPAKVEIQEPPGSESDSGLGLGTRKRRPPVRLIACDPPPMKSIRLAPALKLAKTVKLFKVTLPIPTKTREPCPVCKMMFDLPDYFMEHVKACIAKASKRESSE